MNAYFNMSVPPRSTVAWNIKAAGERLVFDLAVLPDGETPEAFIGRHADELDAVKRPRLYMVAEPLGRDATLPEGYRLCTDPLLAVAVICRTVNGLYVPNRAILPHPRSPREKICFSPQGFPRIGRKSTPELRRGRQ